MSNMMTKRQIVEAERERLLSRLTERQWAVCDRITEAVDRSRDERERVFFAQRGFSRRDLRRALAAMGYERDWHQHYCVPLRPSWQKGDVTVELERVRWNEYVTVFAVGDPPVSVMNGRG